MSRSGDEMIFELAAMLKTAGKKTDEECEESKKDKKEPKEPEEKEEEKKTEKPKSKKKSKKATVLSSVLNDLVKMANSLDEVGAQDASNLIDDALQVILKNVQAFDLSSEKSAMGDEFEDEPAPVDVGVPPREYMPEVGSSGDDIGSDLVITPEIAKLLVDKGWDPPAGFNL
jgi:hypothetical protein